MVVELWGIKGGFHYFSENVSPAAGASYTGSGSNNLWTQLLPCTNSIYNLNLQSQSCFSVCHLDLVTWRHYDFKQLSYFKLVRSDGTETLWDSYENGLNNIAKHGETVAAGCASGLVY